MGLSNRAKSDQQHYILQGDRAQPSEVSDRSPGTADDDSGSGAGRRRSFDVKCLNGVEDPAIPHRTHG